MKKLILTTAAAVVFTAGIALTPASASAQVFVRIGPPAPIHEVVPPPRPGYIWREGYHRWDGHRYVWVGGTYIHERRGHEWVPGHWDEGPRGHFWVEGHWR